MAEAIINRNVALTEFDRALADYEHAYDPVPDEALKFVPSGEDYTLGGLAVHVADVIYHYDRVFDLIHGSGFQQVRAIDPEDDAKRNRDRLIHDGFSGERTGVFREVKEAHDALVSRLRALSADDFARAAPVLYGPDAQEPYDTRPADIVGWLRDHYVEHTDQVGQLLGRWRSERNETTSSPR